MASFKVAEEETRLTVVRTVQVEFDSSNQVRETEDAVIVPAILARECVSNYCGGRGYKPGSELKDAAWTLDGAWVVTHQHVDSVFVKDRAVIRGKVGNIRFNDENGAVLGEIQFLKSRCDQALLDNVRNGSLSKDVSAAYFCDEVYSAGKFGDDAYDFVQKNFMFGHVAVGVVEGRCPSPFCGMSMDSFGSFLRVCVRDPALFVSCRLSTVALDAKAGVYALVGKLRGEQSGDAVVRDYMFEVAKGWTLEEAEAWVKT
ncbi:MAG: DUF2213 domain-containing protein, partial [Crenarchaeota archaeon]|nr:DUF2213 domain-containing protein [Thermoproteota archaeon]